MLTYIQKSGHLLDAEGELVGVGYSGFGLAKNDPAAQHVPNVGPIPVGFYTMEEPIDSPSHGPFAIPLTPDPSNEMFGRSAFLMHGDSIQHPGGASEGCIIQGPATRHKVWDSGDHRLQVIAEQVEVGDEGPASD